MTTLLIYSHQPNLAEELIAQGKRWQPMTGARVVAAVLQPAGPLNTDQLITDYFACGADAVAVGEDPTLSAMRPEVVAAALAQAMTQTGATTLLTDSTRRGKEVAPRVAQKVGAGCVTNALAVDWENGHWLVQRPALGGNTVVTEAMTGPYQVIAVMPKTFEPGQRQAGKSEIIHLQLQLPASPVQVLETRPKGGEGVNLEEAELLIGVGRGIAKQEDLALIQELAATLGAEIGCTRSLATDYHWFPESRMIGLSGKRVKPKLYLAIGLSGQIQHTVGISGAKVIAAINSDQEAPIFQISDYSIVGDLYQIVPTLITRLKARS